MLNNNEVVIRGGEVSVIRVWSSAFCLRLHVSVLCPEYCTVLLPVSVLRREQVNNTLSSLLTCSLQVDILKFYYKTPFVGMIRVGDSAVLWRLVRYYHQI